MIMHIVFKLYDVLRFDSTVVIYVLTISFFISKLRVHKYTSGLTSTPRAELFCSCKRWKFI